MAGKTYQLEINIFSKLDSLPLKNVEVKLFEDHKLVQKLLSDESGRVLFVGLRSKKYSFAAIGDTSEFVSYQGDLQNKNRRDVQRFIYLKPMQRNFTRYCEKLVDDFFENEGSAYTVDTTEKCKSESFSDPQFPGGLNNMSYFISHYLNYPIESIELGEQGKVYISFFVEPDGRVTDIRILKGVSPLIDKEARRIVDQMPRWIPGVCNGHLVRSKMNLPLNFALF